MRLDELTPEQRENLSTEEIIQLAATLSCDERLHCSVPLTPIIRLVVYLHNTSCERAVSQVSLEVLNPDQMRYRLLFQLNQSTVQRAHIIGRPLLDLGILHVEDFVNIFKLDASSVKWQAHDIYKIIDGVFHRVE